MPQPFLLSRVLLSFDGKSDDLLREISSAAFTPDGSLWLGSDELLTLERLSPLKPCVFGKHQPFFIGDFIDLFNHEDEIDIEGLDYHSNYLWLTGSHSTKRKKAKGKKPEKDIERLAKIKTDINRYLVARIPVIEGELLKSCSHPDNPSQKLTAACLEKSETHNLLIDILREDPHLSPFISAAIPSKDNGLDIEGLAVHKDRVFLGLRGPVLRGWAIILEIEVEEKEPGVLTLKTIGKDERRYRKHFIDLDGLGVRELCFKGKDLIILAGATMTLEASMKVFRLKKFLDISEDSISSQESGDLTVLFNLKCGLDTDQAEGLALYPCLGESDSLLVVYDSPEEARIPAPHQIYADVFRLD
ncbi:MAG: DUF3616 domain-containing protein [Coleofasciculaceae cyanobacterium]